MTTGDVLYDLYESNETDTARFVLGVEGKPKLYVFCLNPSTANKEKTDTTITKVKKVARQAGFQGFVMLNLYPLRSTKPKGLPQNPDPQQIEQNVNHIISLVEDDKSPVFWAAWGVNIMLRSYLAQSLQLIASRVNNLGGSWRNYGELTRDGHPRHPSRLSYSSKFSKFEISEYLRLISR